MTITRSEPVLSLGPDTMVTLPANVTRPAYDTSALRCGIVHFGPGAFHRAHQAVYTDDAIALADGAWGIHAIALRNSDTPQTLAQQAGLYTVTTLTPQPTYRIVGCLRAFTAAPLEPIVVLDALAAPATHIVTLTVTEKGYTLAADGALDIAHPDIVHDLRGVAPPRSAVGWLVAGLTARRGRGGKGLTILSCDNLTINGAKLRAAVLAFAGATDPQLADWIDNETRFPNTMVDCIVPATDDVTRVRVAAAIGATDLACVQREPFSQWVIEDNFAGPRPAWDEAGAELVADVAPYQQLKLHGLNLPHSALAYLGLLRSLTYCREAIGDRDIGTFIDALMDEEVAPALPALNVKNYWRTTRQRFANPRINHATRQVGEDGSIKLAQRVLPLLIANARAGRPCGRLAAVVHAWLLCSARGLVKDPNDDRLKAWARARAPLFALLANAQIFPDEFRTDQKVRAAISNPDPFFARLQGAAR